MSKDLETKKRVLDALKSQIQNLQAEINEDEKGKIQGGFSELTPDSDAPKYDINLYSCGGTSANS